MINIQTGNRCFVVRREAWGGAATLNGDLIDVSVIDATSLRMSPAITAVVDEIKKKMEDLWFHGRF